MGPSSFRLALALLVPPIPALILGVLVLVSGQTSFSFQTLLGAAGVGFIGAMLVGYPVMFLLGAPTHLLLKRTMKRELWHYAIAGAVAGVITVLALFVRNQGSYLELVPMALVVGVANASLFWLIRRPDRDGAAP